MTHETGPEMDEAFARRMRRGLVAMPPREVARTRRIRRTAATGAAGVLALAIVSVLGVQTLGAGQGGVEAVPTPSPTVVETPSPEPSTEPTPTPQPSVESEPEPAPPPGFEGVAAGQPVVTGTFDTSQPHGDAGAGVPDEPYVVQDVYVLCRGAGTVGTRYEVVDCTQHPDWTVLATLGVHTFASEGTSTTVTLSPDFTGTVRVVAAGEAPGGIGVGGVAAAWVGCYGDQTVGGIDFACTWTSGSLVATEQAAWGIPYAADELVPRIVRADPEGYATIRFQLQPDS